MSVAWQLSMISSVSIVVILWAKKRKSVRCGYYVSLADNNWPDLLSWGWCYNPKILPVMYFFANHSKTFQICITLSPIWHYFANLLQLSPESIRAFVMFVISRLLKFISINSNATRASTHWAKCSIQSLLPAITHSPFFLQDGSPVAIHYNIVDLIN